jgi:hypothetical protein
VVVVVVVVVAEGAGMTAYHGGQRVYSDIVSV